MTRTHWIAHAAAVVAFVTIGLNALLASTSCRPAVVVTIIGLTLETVGILLLALDFWWPPILRGFAWLTRWGVRTRLRELVSGLIARLTGRRGSIVVSTWTLPFETQASGFPPTERYADVRSFEDVERRLQDLAQRISDLGVETAAKHERLRRGINELDKSLRDDVREWIRQSKDQYLVFRIAGLFIALSGTVVLGVGNLLTS